MFIDALTHITPDGGWFGSAHDASEDRLLREMQAAGVRRAVVVALADYISNDYVLDACQRHSDVLIPGASFNPVRYKSSREAARECRLQLHESAFSILKLHPRLNNYDPLDPRCLSILEEIASWQKPMKIWFCSMLYKPGIVLRKPIVDTCFEIVNRFPDLTFVLLHGGGTQILNLAEAVRPFPNVYLDLSFTIARYIHSSVGLDLRTLAEIMDRRLLLGSDFPEVTPSEALKHFEWVAEGASGEKKANILGNNLKAILEN